jgi:hypothetical protein
MSAGLTRVSPHEPRPRVRHSLLFPRWGASGFRLPIPLPGPNTRTPLGSVGRAAKSKGEVRLRVQPPPTRDTNMQRAIAPKHGRHPLEPPALPPPGRSSDFRSPEPGGRPNCRGGRHMLVMEGSGMKKKKKRNQSCSPTLETAADVVTVHNSWRQGVPTWVNALRHPNMQDLPAWTTPLRAHHQSGRPSYI